MIIIVNTKHVMNKDITKVFKSVSDIFPFKILTKLYLIVGIGVDLNVEEISSYKVVCEVDTSMDVMICDVVTSTVDCKYFEVED